MAHRPVIVFEHQRSTAAQCESGPERVSGVLVEQFEIRLFDLDGDGPYSLARLQHAYTSGNRFTFFAVSAGTAGRE